MMHRDVAQGIPMDHFRAKRIPPATPAKRRVHASPTLASFARARNGLDFILVPSSLAATNKQ
eukprot:CAMPEP_0185266226 /NCGR_PEP_ID=MMETSP1359-20130426/30377_1 /TAXON_ID=552665 /ORGANISM="Bigelowiella longifila, Strain CCMP242" /LENGTH=61 /DNA_ID=CAMNT_0027855933 /DNA_START=128 /DNA_END=313 /DNA_ORIENTATION=+